MTDSLTDLTEILVQMKNAYVRLEQAESEMRTGGKGSTVRLGSELLLGRNDLSKAITRLATHIDNEEEELFNRLR